MSPASPASRMQQKREAILRHLIFAAEDRCACGAGFAYDARFQPHTWDCSAILLGDALMVAGERGACDHSPPCAYVDLLSERHATAVGATTRPA